MKDHKTLLELCKTVIYYSVKTGELYFIQRTVNVICCVILNVSMTCESMRFLKHQVFLRYDSPGVHLFNDRLDISKRFLIGVV